MELAVVRLISTVVLCSLAGSAFESLEAQGGDSTVIRVQRLVNAGDRAGARRLADSVLVLATDGSPAYAEALFARAFASSAVEAERDYLRVSFEYSLSARAEDATMMVAQLKLARSDRVGARRNFERLVREHPAGAQAAKAAFWAGRLALEDGDAAAGCPSLGRARSRVSRDDVELANQIDYYAQRCSASALAGVLPQPAVAESAVTPPPVATQPTGKPPLRPTPKAVTRDPVPARSPESPRAPEPATQPATERATTPTAAPQAASPPAPIKEFSVQVAAFPKVRDAVALAEVLQQRGFQVRVWGSKAPFRVREGRYSSRADAEAARTRMKASRVNGIVVEAEAM